MTPILIRIEPYGSFILYCLPLNFTVTFYLFEYERTKCDCKVEGLLKIVFNSFRKPSLGAPDNTHDLHGPVI